MRYLSTFISCKRSILICQLQQLEQETYFAKPISTYIPLSFRCGNHHEEEDEVEENKERNESENYRSRVTLRAITVVIHFMHESIANHLQRLLLLLRSVHHFQSKVVNINVLHSE